MTLFTTTLTQGPDTLVFTGHDLFDIPWTIDDGARSRHAGLTSHFPG